MRLRKLFIPAFVDIQYGLWKRHPIIHSSETDRSISCFIPAVPSIHISLDKQAIMFGMTVILSFFYKGFAFGFQIRQQINISCFHDIPLIDVFSFSHLIPPSLSTYEKRGLNIIFSPLTFLKLSPFLTFYFLLVFLFF